MDKQKNQVKMTNAKLIRLLNDSDLANVIECPASFNGGKAMCGLSLGDISPVECLACKKKWLGEEALSWQ